MYLLAVIASGISNRLLGASLHIRYIAALADGAMWRQRALRAEAELRKLKKWRVS